MRKITETTRIANLVIHLTGHGWMKFNDKMNDGRRSLKVFGWEYKDYEMARNLLLIHGHYAEIVCFGAYSFRGGCNYTQYRLHVKEFTEEEKANHDKEQIRAMLIELMGDENAVH
jgi:hypothetical protein